MGKRKCVNCGPVLGDENLIKIILKDGSCEMFPFSTCPKCFQKELLESHSVNIMIVDVPKFINL